MKIHKILLSAAAALCITASVIPHTSPISPASAASDNRITVGYYSGCSGFQNGSSDDERKSGYAYEYLQELAKYTGWEYSYIYGSFDEITGMLKNGEIDLVAGISESWLERNIKDGSVKLSPYSTGTEDEEVFNIPGASNDSFYIAVSDRKVSVYGELSAAQKKINQSEPLLCSELYQKYFSQSSRTENSDKVKRWLGARTTIRVGYIDNYMPYSDKVDSKNNTADGAMVTIFNLIRDKAGKSVSAFRYNTAEEMYSDLKSGKLEAVFPVQRDLWQIENENLIASSAFAEDKLKLVFSENAGGDVFGRVAVLKSSPVQNQYITEYHPDSEILYCDSVSECVKAVNKGNASSFVIEGNVLTYYLSDGNTLKNLKAQDISGQIEYCFAFRKDCTALCELTSSVMCPENAEDIRDAVNSSLYKKNDFTFVEFFLHNIARVIIIISSVLVLAVLFFVRHRIAIRKKQSEIDNANQKASEKAKETSKYKEKTERDLLTGVFSRGHFIEEANKKMSSHRPNDTLQLVMMDIDNFKSVNDTYGHDNGDVVLSTLGGYLKEISRVNGFAGRFGGEEFFIFLYGENPDIQEHIVSQVCKKLRETDFSFTDRHITMSVGLTRINDGDTLEKCIERADKALYYSKKHGKDQYNWFEDIIDKL